MWTRTSLLDVWPYVFHYSIISTLVSDQHTSKASIQETAGRITEIIQTNKTIASGTSTFRRWLFYFLAAETLIVNLVTCIMIYTQCEKVETIWDPVGTPSKCWSPAVQAVSHAFYAISILTH